MIGAKPSRNAKQLTLSAALLFGSVTVCLLVGEIALRALGPGYGNAPRVDHPIFHHWNPSNYSMRVWGHRKEYGGHEVSYNSLGLAMPGEVPSRNTRSIVLLGDSFTLAREVPVEQRYGDRLGERLGISTLNFGCGSLSPLLSWLQLKHFEARISPSVVVLQVYANDIDDDAEMRRLATTDASGNIVAVPGDRTSPLVRAGRRIHLVRWARRVFLERQFKQRMAERTGIQWEPHQWSPFFTRPLDESFPPEVLRGFEHNVEQIQAWCDAHACPFILWAVPDRGSLLHVQEDYLDEYLRGWSIREEIRYVSMVDAFRAIDARLLFHDHDVHFTPRAHELCAELLAGAIEEALRASPVPADSVGAAIK